MKLTKRQIRVMIESIIREINLNTDAELFRKNTTSHPGYADNVISQRSGLSSSAFAGQYYEDPTALYEEDSESESSSEEGLDEFSSVGGGAAGASGQSLSGFSVPLGMKHKKSSLKKAKKSKKK